MANFPMGSLGPCEVLFDDVSLGYNMQVNFECSDDTTPVRTAQHGTGSFDEIFTGTSVTCTVQMTEPTLAQLAAGMPGVTVTADEAMFATLVGTSMRDNAKQLVLKRQTGTTASSDETQWLTVFYAYPRRNMNIQWDASTQRIFEVIFVGFPAIVGGSAAGGETFEVDDLFAIGYGQTS